MTERKIVEVVAALIRDGEKFMICQRPENKARGLLWEFVGGKVEPGEAHRDALVRECREELGITVEPGSLFTSVVHEYPDVKIRLSVYNAVIVSGEPKLIEHADLRWITPAETDRFAFCPADTDILELIKRTVF